jgi:ACS family glucarate transporter-like MFS transporter
MNIPAEKPTNVRYGVLGFACVLSMITYLDRVCFGTVAPIVQSEFGLKSEEMGWIFGAFTFAYAVFEVPTGWLGDVFGPRKTLIRIVLWWSLFTVLTGSIYPSFFAFFAMLAVRFFFGIGEAGAYPNIARAFHNWFPFNERGFAKGTVWMAGRFAGGVTPFIVLALLYETPVDGAAPLTHWRHIFWIFGVIGVVWCVGFWLWFRDRPEESPLVNQAEIDLIHYGDPSHNPLLAAAPPAQAETKDAIQAGPPTASALSEGEPPPQLPFPRKPGAGRIQVPWKKLFTSSNLWVLCFMYFCASYGWYFNITYLPGFLKTQFHMDPGEKWTSPWWQYSLMAGLPLLVGSVACIVGGFSTDLFIKRTGNRKWGRRLFGMLGHGLCATFYFLSMTVMGAESPWPFVLCIAVATFWNDMTMGAAWASCIDIGRRYSGIVSGCMNTIGNLGGFTANILTGYILKYYTRDFDKDLDAVGYNAALQNAWIVNFVVFSAVYVLAAFLWMNFDATEPVAPEEGEH